MRRSRKLNSAVLALFALVLMSAAARAADPGSPLPANAEASDQKTGSVLVYNLYTSSPVDPSAQDTRISITNTNSYNPVAVHVFFVDGSSGSVADAFGCATQNHTFSFLVSDIDPGVTGYIVAVAADTLNGCPLYFNFLAGTAHIKLASGHSASLSAETFAAVFASETFTPNGCSNAAIVWTLKFDGAMYNRAARALAIDKLRSPADGNSTLLVINSLSGNLATGLLSGIGPLAGQLFNGASPPNSYPFTFSSGSCQFRAMLSDSFPATTPPFSTVIPSGRTGWMKVWTTNDRAITGAVINFNANATNSPAAFNGGRNLRKLTLTDTGVITIPVFPSNCF